MSEFFGFEGLEVWNKAREIKNEISEEIKTFPREEKYRLVDQLTRSSRSIGSLIAEGHGRFSFPDQIHFCIQARGSLVETMNHLIDAYDAGYLLSARLDYFRIKLKQLERLLNGYLNYLRKQKTKIKSHVL